MVIVIVILLVVAAFICVVIDARWGSRRSPKATPGRTPPDRTPPGRTRDARGHKPRCHLANNLTGCSPAPFVASPVVGRTDSRAVEQLSRSASPSSTDTRRRGCHGALRPAQRTRPDRSTSPDAPTYTLCPRAGHCMPGRRPGRHGSDGSVDLVTDARRHEHVAGGEARRAPG